MLDEKSPNLQATIVMTFLCLREVMSIQVYNDSTKISLHQNSYVNILLYNGI